MATENNSVGLDVTEEIAVAFTSASMNLQLFDVNKETLEETMIDSVKLDMSCLLFPTGNIDVSN